MAGLGIRAQKDPIKLSRKYLHQFDTYIEYGEKGIILNLNANIKG